MKNIVVQVKLLILSNFTFFRNVFLKFFLQWVKISIYEGKGNLLLANASNLDQSTILPCVKELIHNHTIPTLTVNKGFIKTLWGERRKCFLRILEQIPLVY